MAGHSPHRPSAQTPPRAPPAAAAAIVASYIESLSPYLPGKPIEEVAREFGVPDCVKLASNENPLGASPLALAAIRDSLAHVHLYPDGSCFALKRKLAERHHVSPAEVVVGAGTNEILTLLVRTFLAEGEEALLSENTFLVYRLAVQSCGRSAVAVPMRDHRYDLDAMAAAIGPRTKLIFIANPDNPNGTYVGKAELERFLAQVPERVLVVLDEAYFEFASGVAAGYPDGCELRKLRPRLVVLRTFSKIYGLASLRVGYGLAEPDVANYLDRVRDPFNVSSVAQVAALAALDDDAHVASTKAVTFQGRDLLARELPRFGFKVVPSVTNFVLALTGRSEEDGSAGRRAEAEGRSIRSEEDGSAGRGAEAEGRSIRSEEDGSAGRGAEAEGRSIRSEEDGSAGRGAEAEGRSIRSEEDGSAGRRAEAEGRSIRSGEELFQGLLRHGVIVRPMGGYGMPEAVRISVGTPAENERLIRALEIVVGVAPRRAAGPA